MKQNRFAYIHFRINFLDNRLDQLKPFISECIDSSPLILLMDSINMYRERKHHDRLFQDVGPKMWNFTGRAVMIPDLTDITELLSCKETTTELQIDMEFIMPEDILLGKEREAYGSTPFSSSNAGAIYAVSQYTKFNWLYKNVELVKFHVMFICTHRCLILSILR